MPHSRHDKHAFATRWLSIRRTKRQLSQHIRTKNGIRRIARVSLSILVKKVIVPAVVLYIVLTTTEPRLYQPMQEAASRAS